MAAVGGAISASVALQPAELTSVGLKVPNAPDSPQEAAGVSDNGDLTFPEGTLLPTVKCIVYLALNGSTQLPLFEYQMKRLGFWDRVIVHISEPDPDGKAAGCFRSHVMGWNIALTKGCDHALMMEEDVYLNEPVVKMGMDNAEAFLASGDSYDL